MSQSDQRHIDKAEEEVSYPLPIFSQGVQMFQEISTLSGHAGQWSCDRQSVRAPTIPVSW